ncbi:MAG TPA: cation diffusion facilitator family transporter [Streptosporangiaceae bacterium]
MTAGHNHPRAGPPAPGRRPRTNDPRADDPHTNDPRTNDPRTNDPRAAGPQSARHEATGPRPGGQQAAGRQAGGRPVGHQPVGHQPGGHQPGGHQPTGKKAVFAAFAANLGIAVTKFIAFLITGSAAMAAESVHSVADSSNQALLLIGRRRSQRDETEEHQFGFGAERYFYAFVVAVVLFTVGAVFSGYEGIQRINHPEHLTSPVAAFAVLAIAIIGEGLSFRTAVAESNETRRGESWRSFIRHAKAPELPAILLEDFAALIGLLIALCGVSLSVITGSERWDGVASLAIGVLLGCVAVVLAVEMKSLLIGEAASRDTERAIVTALEEGPEVHRVIHLRTLHVGPDTLLVAAKIAVTADESAAGLTQAIDSAERRIRAAVPIAELIYLEPDLYQEGRDDEADPAVRAARRSSRRGMIRTLRGRPRLPARLRSRR